MNSILEVKDMTKKYDDFCLDHINFSLPSGSIMGLIGENGAGKTTTIKAILKLIDVDEGCVNIFGSSYDADEKLIKKQIGVVFDECNFHYYMDAFKVSKIMQDIHPGWDSDLFRQYLKNFNISEKKTVKEMSRGMRVKFSLAVALAHRPKLLILDESTSGLDPVSRDDILDILMEFIQDEEHSVLISSHITSDLEKIADYITFLHEGKIILSKSKDELIYNYGIIKCKQNDFDHIDKQDIISYLKKDYGYEILIENKEKINIKYRNLTIDNASIEEIMLFHIKGELQ